MKEMRIFPGLLLALAACGSMDADPQGETLIVEASYGGRLPGLPNWTLRIDGSGAGRWTEYLPEGGKILKERNFSLDRDAQEALIRAARKNGFFDLPSGPHDSGAHDGSYCSLELAIAGRRHRVTIVNFNLAAFNAVARAVNARVPDACRIRYNELTEK